MQNIKNASLVAATGSYNYKIIIPKKVESKIRILCSFIDTVEWSGVLFFKTEGSFDDNNLVITCVDILPMDYGLTTTTEFKIDESVANYMVTEDLMDCDQGLIHSHNSMATFFSSTDDSTLVEEGKDRNFFVSLIVNNAGTYTAAVTRKSTIIGKVVNYVTKKSMDDSNDIVTTSEPYDVDGGIVVEKFPLIVEKEEVEWYDKDLVKRITSLKGKTTTVKTFNKSFYKSSELPFKTKETSLFTSKKDKETSKSEGQLDKTWLDDAVSGYYGYDNWEGYDDANLDSKIPEGYHVIDTDIEKEYTEEEKKEINNYIFQILKGEISVEVDGTDLIKWIKEDMPVINSKRFETFNSFRNWINNFMDFVLNEAMDKDLIQGIYSEFLLIEEELGEDDNEYFKEIMAIICDFAYDDRQTN